jgi:hypothetical protein
MDKEAFVEILKDRFGAALEAVAVSKDDTRAFVLTSGGQQDGFLDSGEFSKIGQYDVEFCRLDTYDNAFLIFLRRSGGDVRLFFDEKQWLGRLMSKATDPNTPRFELPKARIQDYLI